MGRLSINPRRRMGGRLASPSTSPLLESGIERSFAPSRRGPTPAQARECAATRSVTQSWQHDRGPGPPPERLGKVGVQGRHLCSVRSNSARGPLPPKRARTSPRSGGRASRVPRWALPERVDGLAGATGQVPRWLQVGQGWYIQATRVKLRGGHYKVTYPTLCLNLVDRFRESKRVQLDPRCEDGFICYLRCLIADRAIETGCTFRYTPDSLLGPFLSTNTRLSTCRRL
jgi:hypothetical protein